MEVPGSAPQSSVPARRDGWRLRSAGRTGRRGPNADEGAPGGPAESRARAARPPTLLSGRPVSALHHHPLPGLLGAPHPPTFLSGSGSCHPVALMSPCSSRRRPGPGQLSAGPSAQAGGPCFISPSRDYEAPNGVHDARPGRAVLGDGGCRACVSRTQSREGWGGQAGEPRGGRAQNPEGTLAAAWRPGGRTVGGAAGARVVTGPLASALRGTQTWKENSLSRPSVAPRPAALLRLGTGKGRRSLCRQIQSFLPMPGTESRSLQSVSSGRSLGLMSHGDSAKAPR